MAVDNKYRQLTRILIIRTSASFLWNGLLNVMFSAHKYTEYKISKVNLEATPDTSSEIRCSEEFKEHRSLRRGEKILKICADMDWVMFYEWKDATALMEMKIISRGFDSEIPWVLQMRWQVSLGISSQL